MNLHHGLPKVIHQLPDTLSRAERDLTSGPGDQCVGTAVGCSRLSENIAKLI